MGKEQSALLPVCPWEWTDRQSWEEPAMRGVQQVDRANL